MHPWGLSNEQPDFVQVGIQVEKLRPPLTGPAQPGLLGVDSLNLVWSFGPAQPGLLRMNSLEPASFIGVKRR